MRIFSLSHTDLDGYACQYVLNTFFKDCSFYNANYGKEINEKLDLIKDEIAFIHENFPHEKVILIISDLNLTLTQCEDLQSELFLKGAKLLLLDHHATGAVCEERYPWYFLDTNRCAAKIVFDFFSKNMQEDEKLLKLRSLIEVVNAVDIWLQDDPGFVIGKVFLEMIATARELNRVIFAKQNREYIFELLRRAASFIGKENASVSLDDSLHFIKKDFFIKGEDDTLSNLVSKYVVDLLTKDKEKYELFYAGYKGIMTMNIGNVSVIGNDFLEANPDCDFFLDVTSRKTMSFRANDKLDVSLMAKNLVGGGGHPNASGGFYAAFKDSSDYLQCKEQIKYLINQKEQNV